MNFVRIIHRLSLLVLAVGLLCSLISCGGEESDGGAEAVKLSFKSAASYETLKELDGKKVTINGYIATSSPVDKSFIFLMNLPYQSCPFCKPNTSELSNTMEVYPKKGADFDYTTQAIKVTGTLCVAADPSAPFTDLYGYEFNFKIVDAEYTILKDSDLTADMALWQRVAQTDVVNEIYSMYDYVYFLCRWDTYFVNSYEDVNGQMHAGYYLWPADAERYIKTEGAQYNYGYKDGYFDAIAAKLTAIDATAFSDMVENIQSAKDLAARALAELNDGHYTSEHKFVEKFNTEDDVFTLTKGEEFNAEFETLYAAFTDWLSGWEM